ncbi:MAG TPA: response regulator [Vicinamibacterales bacterium]|jgi:CheY-like chemotaxis protein
MSDNPSILVVDDDSAVRRAVARFLRAEGLDVLEASNGEEGLTRLREAPEVSAILLDLRMPIMDGWTFRRAQRQDPAIADIPVVIMSGADVDRFNELEAAATFEKPVQMSEVAVVLHKLCGTPDD